MSPTACKVIRHSVYEPHIGTGDLERFISQSRRINHVVGTYTNAEGWVEALLHGQYVPQEEVLHRPHQDILRVVLDFELAAMNAVKSKLGSTIQIGACFFFFT